MPNQQAARRDLASILEEALAIIERDESTLPPPTFLIPLPSANRSTAARLQNRPSTNLSLLALLNMDFPMPRASPSPHMNQNDFSPAKNP
jgi:hypothetical protein